MVGVVPGGAGETPPLSSSLITPLLLDPEGGTIISPVFHDPFTGSCSEQEVELGLEPSHCLFLIFLNFYILILFY